MPYIAPEVYANMTYHAEPADIWSCGVILVAMLAGGNYFEYINLCVYSMPYYIDNTNIFWDK